MFGPFKPTASLSGGLLWKRPWRMSAPQKLRQRRRLRRVDNVISVLDTALQRQAASIAPSANSTFSSSSPSAKNPAFGSATPEELSQTGEGQRLLDRATHPQQEARRHGRGPHQGEFVPENTPEGVSIPGRQLLGDEARRTGTIKLIERWKNEMPTEQEMLPRDKYTMFDRKEKRYRKGIHKLPKWTRVSQRLNPPGF